MLENEEGQNMEFKGNPSSVVMPIFRVVFSAFFRQICRETCRNFELDEILAELDRKMGEL